MPRKRAEGTRAPNGAASIYLGRRRPAGTAGSRWAPATTAGPTAGTSAQAPKPRSRARSATWNATATPAGSARPGRAMTVEAWLTHWLDNIAAPSVRPKTLAGYRTAVR